MNQDSYREFYEKEYRQLYVGDKEPLENFFKTQIIRGQNIERTISQNMNYSFKNKFVLEVGCGAGGILKHFKKTGCRIKGCDLDMNYLNYGKENYNLDLEYGTLNTIQLQEKPDIIIYSHVLEHILNLNDELQTIKKVLKPGGYLYIEVPSVKNMKHHLSYKSDFLKILQNAHTYHFTQTSLKNLLGKNGFTFQFGDEAVRSVFSNEGKNDHKITNDYHEAISFLISAEKYRKFFWFDPKNLKRLLRRESMKVIDLLHFRDPLKQILNRPVSK
jgi:2-polyprenyl-3-methyl-5-hydroxy-6-metoxy-1,4-benzoquinol methylase